MRIERFTPQNVYYWMQNRYNQYDENRREYIGKDNVDKVVLDACDYFEMSEDDILNSYNSFIYSKESVMSGFDGVVDKDINDAKKLDNKKVKLNVDRIIKTKSAQSGKIFLDFVKANKDNIFTARVDKVNKSLLYLEEQQFWLFDSKDLILIK